jgi:acetylornithine aminotransferase
LAVLDIIESEDLVARAETAGERLTDALLRATAGNPAVKEIRGLGLLIAIELAGEWASEIVGRALERGLVVNNVAPDVVRLAPPLIVSGSQIDTAVGVLAALLSSYKERV